MVRRVLRILGSILIIAFVVLFTARSAGLA